MPIWLVLYKQSKIIGLSPLGLRVLAGLAHLCQSKEELVLYPPVSVTHYSWFSDFDQYLEHFLVDIHHTKSDSANSLIQM